MARLEIGDEIPHQNDEDEAHKRQHESPEHRHLPSLGCRVGARFRALGVLATADSLEARAAGDSCKQEDSSGQPIRQSRRASREGATPFAVVWGTIVAVPPRPGLELPWRAAGRTGGTCGMTRRRLVSILVAVVATPAALYGLTLAYFVFVVPSSDDYRHRLAFDAASWRQKSADAADWPTRLRMVDSLIERRLLGGRTQPEVVELLGPPDHTSKWRDWDLVYHLGPEREALFRIDSEWLVIRLDSRRTVVSNRTVAD